MPKPLVNNKIVYQNLYGRVLRFDNFLNQGVRSGDSPTFANLRITGDSLVEGNLYVQGNSTILDSNVIQFEDNIILINRNETGAGVTLNQAGFEIDRGSQENYRFVYNESDKTFRIGTISALQAVATRETTPLTNGIMTWNNTAKRIDAVNNITIDTTFSSTTDSAGVTTGSVLVSGGMGIGRNVTVNGGVALQGSNNSNKSLVYTDKTSNSLVLSAPQAIELNPTTNVRLPFGVALVFGNTTGGATISASQSTQDLNISGNGDINFTLSYGKRISVPNGIPITFSTLNEKVYTDSSNNMVVTGRQDIHLVPGANAKVFIPTDLPLAFGNAYQTLSANINNDLALRAANNINLTPGVGAYVQLPVDNPIKFGVGGNQRIYANSNNDLYVLSTGDLNLSSQSRVNVPGNIPLTFGGALNYMQANTLGNLLIGSGMSVVVTSSQDSTNGTTGAIYTVGGLGVQKTLYVEGATIVDSNNATALSVRKNGNVQTVFNVDTSSTGSLSAVAETFLITSPSASSAMSMLQLVTMYDTTPGYSVGRGTTAFNSGRSFTVSLPSYSDYANVGARPKFSVTTATRELFSVESDTGIVTFLNTDEAINATSAGVVISGGVAILKNIFATGNLTVKTDSTAAMSITDTNSTSSALLVDTVNNKTSIHSALIVDANAKSLQSYFQSSIRDSTQATSTSVGAFVVSGGAAVNKDLYVGGTGHFLAGSNMHNTKITNVLNPTNDGDAATKAYVDLVKQGLFVKDSVQVATNTNGSLNTSFVAGGTVDNYTLVVGDRILVKNQDDATENGIYVVPISGAPQRAIDMRVGTSAAGVFVFVENGSMNSALGFICNSPLNASQIGTDGINFTQFTGAGRIVAGGGLSKVFNEVSVNVDDSSLEITLDTLRIKSTAVGTGLTGGSGTPIETSTNQSHVTQLGTIVSGTWNASAIAVPYGGTGQTQFSSGHLLFGNASNGLGHNNNLFFDSTRGYLGIGSGSPTAQVYINNATSTSVVLNTNTSGSSQVIFTTNNNTQGSLSYSNSFINLSSQSAIQLVTAQQSRMVISSTGNVGINATNPSATLQVGGTFALHDVATFQSTTNATGYTNGAIVVAGGASVAKNMYIAGKTRVGDTTPSTSSNVGAVVIEGGLSVKGIQNAANVGNGGALTVVGGASIGGDLYIGGQINGAGSSSSTFAYLTLTATDEAVNLTTGALVTFGGITIQCTTNASSVTDGGSFLVSGGASFGGDLFIGGNSYNYGSQSMFGSSDNVISIYDSNQMLRWSLDRNWTTADFSLSRYSAIGELVEQTLRVDSLTGVTTFNNTIAVQSTESATNLTTGAFTIAGGQAVGENVLIGGRAEIFSDESSTSCTGGALVVHGSVGVNRNLNVADGIRYNGNSALDTLQNTTDSAQWYYVGDLQSNYVDVKLTGQGIFDLHFYGQAPDFAHSRFGNGVQSGDNCACYVYELSGAYYLFILVPAHASANVHLTGSLVISNDCFSQIEPWLGLVEVYSTNKASNVAYDVGDLTVEGTRLRVCDNMPVIGYNNDNTVATRSLGIQFQRYQQSNDLGEGDVVSDAVTLTDTIPTQTLVQPSTQIKLSNATSSINDFYIGWWIKTSDNQVRQIVKYYGNSHVADIDTAWTSQPQDGDLVSLFHKSVVTLTYDETSQSFNFGESDVDLQRLYVETITVNSTVGDSITTDGGAHIAKCLSVGTSIGIGTTQPDSSITIQQTSAGINLQSSPGNESYVTFSDYKIAADFATQSLQLGYNGSSILTLTSTGNVGIGTTSISSGLTVAANTLVTIDSTTGYLGFIAGNVSSTAGARLMLSSNTLGGNVDVSAAGTTTGSIVMRTGTNNAPRLSIDASGTTTIYSTTASKSSTSGSLVVRGGVAISSTENAESLVKGGSMTVAGGMSVGKDFFIGGNLYITGNLNAGGSSYAADVTFSNTQGCSIVSFDNNNLLAVSNQAILTFHVDVVPTETSQMCSFEFTLPERSNSFANRGELVAFCTGYTDDTNLTAVFNIVCTGIADTTRGIVKFQSASTNIHSLTVLCRYAMA
jgi:hypothetical protein